MLDADGEPSCRPARSASWASTRRRCSGATGTTRSPRYRFRLRGWYLTGDLVYADAEGRYYHLDRAVDSVDAGDGRRCFTAMSEERILAACPDVTDCTVVIVAEAGTVWSPTCCWSLAAGADPAEDRTDGSAPRSARTSAATLRRVVPVRADDIPVTVTGKVRKVVAARALPRPEASS